MTVYLVGAGPGDPGLLTVRGAHLLRRAEVVVHDERCDPDLLTLTSVDAEVVAVGPADDDASISHEQVGAFLVHHGLAGREVVRLEVGDSFALGEAAAEAAALVAAGVDFEVVPGVSSAMSAPAAAGIPLASGTTTTPVTVVAVRDDAPIDWRSVARLGGTVVVVNGEDRWPEVVAGLIDGGLDPVTPAAAVRRATHPDQETVRATLGTLAVPDLTEPAPAPTTTTTTESSSIFVVGDVAAIDVGWFERLPLFGKRVIVTRTSAQAPELAHLLRRKGAAPIEVPAIEIVEPSDDAPLRQAIECLGDYDWVVFTSPNGAGRFCDRLPDARALGGVRIAAIGPGTARVLADRNLVADLVPDRFVAEGLLDVFPAPAGHRRVLLARAEEARDVLPDGLAAEGWGVDIVSVYRTVRPDLGAGARASVADADVVTFTSSSTVRHFVEMLGVDAVPRTVACIGPVTAATARELGLGVDVEASTHTIAGLVDALETHFAP